MPPLSDNVAPPMSRSLNVTLPKLSTFFSTKIKFMTDEFTPGSKSLTTQLAIATWLNCSTYCNVNIFNHWRSFVWKYNDINYRVKIVSFTSNFLILFEFFFSCWNKAIQNSNEQTSQLSFFLATTFQLSNFNFSSLSTLHPYFLLFY